MVSSLSRWTSRQRSRAGRCGRRRPAHRRRRPSTRRRGARPPTRRATPPSSSICLTVSAAGELPVADQLLRRRGRAPGDQPFRIPRGAIKPELWPPQTTRPSTAPSTSCNSAADRGRPPRGCGRCVGHPSVRPGCRRMRRARPRRPGARRWRARCPGRRRSRGRRSRRGTRCVGRGRGARPVTDTSRCGASSPVTAPPPRRQGRPDARLSTATTSGGVAEPLGEIEDLEGHSSDEERVEGGGVRPVISRMRPRR